MSNILINIGGMAIIVLAITRVVVSFSSNNNNKGVNNNSWRGLIRDWVGWGWVVTLIITLMAIFLITIIIILITITIISAIVNIYTRTISSPTIATTTTI